MCNMTKIRRICLLSAKEKEKEKEKEKKKKNLNHFLCKGGNKTMI